MKSSYFLIGSFVMVLGISSICSASFFVYFKDGSSREVNKIEFKGRFVELYLTTGSVLRLTKESIDYRVTGIQEPPTDSNGKVILKGTNPDQKTVVMPESKPSGPSQEELKHQWNSTNTTAVAINNFGPIKKGSTVRIVAKTDLNYTVLTKTEDGSYKRSVINSDNFAENFEMNTTSASTPSIKPENESVPALSQPLHQSHVTGPRLRETALRTRPRSLLVPFLLSIGLLAIGILSSIVLSKSDPLNHKRQK